MNDLVIFGSGGFAREVHQVVRDINHEKATWNLLGFLDGDPEKHGQEVHGLPVLGGADWMGNQSSLAVVVAIGATAAKRRVVQDLLSGGVRRFAALVHPRGWLGEGVSIGAGSIVCADVLATTDIRIGDHVILNLSCTVGHDVIIEDYATVAPSVNISGCVRVGEGCDLGTNSTVIQGAEIGNWSIVGAGAAVVADVPSNVTVVGVPSKIIRERPEGWHLEQ